MDVNDDLQLPGNLQNIIDNTNLKWVFISGKGGVGKSSTSSALAIALTQSRSRVLLISLDPAHNLGDCFNQKFCGTPTRANGFANLDVMEIDPKSISDIDFNAELTGASQSGGMLNGFSDVLSQIPGIDEAMALFELIRQIETLDYDIVVFDCAPTGHTTRLLSMTGTLNQLFQKVTGIKDQFGGIIGAVTSMMGDNVDGEAQQGIFDKMAEMQKKVQDVEKRFQDPDWTTFICVCIPEFLSLFETERLVQDLFNLDINVMNIVCNQILFKPEGSCTDCLQCKSRMKMQQKYLDQLDLLYGMDFHLTKMPLLLNEVRGKESLTIFAEMLISGKPDPLALAPPSD